MKCLWLTVSSGLTIIPFCFYFLTFTFSAVYLRRLDSAPTLATRPRCVCSDRPRPPSCCHTSHRTDSGGYRRSGESSGRLSSSWFWLEFADRWEREPSHWAYPRPNSWWIKNWVNECLVKPSLIFDWQLSINVELKIYNPTHIWIWSQALFQANDHYKLNWGIHRCKIQLSSSSLEDFCLTIKSNYTTMSHK